MIRRFHLLLSLLLLLLVSVGTVVAPSPGVAARPSHFSITLVEASARLTPGSSGDIYASVRANTWCVVDFSSRRYSRHVLKGKPFKATTGVLDIGFPVKKSAAGGRWNYVLGCAATRRSAAEGKFSGSKRSAIRISGAKKGARGAITTAVKASSIGTMPAGGDGKGSDAFPAAGTVLIAGSQWFGGNGVNVMSSGETGSETSVWQCVELVKRFMNQRFGVPIQAYGDAKAYWNNAKLAPYVDQHDNGSGYQPVPGDIVVDTAKTYGHVQIVDTNSGGTLTLVDQNSSPTGWATATLQPNGLWKRSNGDTTIHFLHIKTNASASNPVTPTQPPVAASAPTTRTYAETTGTTANTWTNYQAAGGAQGQSIGANQTVLVACVVSGFKVSDGNTAWYQIASAPWSNSYYVSADAFYNNGATTGSLHGTPFTDPAVPACSSGSSPVQNPATTYSETTGSVANTWTDYASAGGSQGSQIGSNQTVQISCKVTGFKVSDGNTWWYRIASAPWDYAYYVSADVFYNNGATSGSLHGTPWVDSNVANC